MEEVKRPQVVNDDFLQPNLIEKLLGKKKKTELKEPLLFLMREDGFMDLLEGVETGVFKIKDKNGIEKKAINLTNDKLTSWRYAGKNYRCWVAYENEFSPYPVHVVHDSGSIYSLIKNALTNKRSLDSEAKLLGEKGKMLFMILVGLALAVYFLANAGVLNGILGTGVGAAAGVVATPSQPQERQLTIEEQQAIIDARIDASILEAANNGS